LATVGIIANPASGKDIRRLVARASIFYNNQKTNIMQRVLVALDAVGVDRVSIMPDYNYMGKQALDGLKLSLRPSILDMPMLGTEADSIRAAEILCEMGAGCIVTLGGDGTNRVVAKGCGRVPLVPISTGTNNVFTPMIEGTIAGLAAGLVAVNAVEPDRVTYPAKWLEVYFEDELEDIALIDVVTCVDTWIGTRAVWDLARIREIVLARAEPTNIGWSSIGGCLQVLDARDRRGLYLALGQGGLSVLAPVAPGVIIPVDVREQRLLALGDEVSIDPGMGTIALDGERQIEVSRQRRVNVRLTDNGPRVVDVRRCMEEAVRNGTLGVLPVSPAIA
jgi:predicted polyphosphate/ATP-dependent NAD kinase